MSTGQDILNKIDSLIVKNMNLITELTLLSDTVQASVNEYKSSNYSLLNTAMFDGFNNKAEILNKKIQDNNASINNMISQVKLDDAYFEDSLTNFFKRAQHYANDISDLIQSGSSISVSIQFMNMGTFYSWDAIANISLSVELYDTDNNLEMQSFFPLDIILNPPGDALTNGDFGLIKTFDETLVMPILAAGDHVFHLTIIDSTHSFEYKFKKNIIVIP